MRRLSLHASALNDSEYELYTAALADIVGDTDVDDGKTKDDAFYEKMCVSVREARAWLRGRYAHVPAGDIDMILKFFSPALAQGDTLTGGQFFAALRLVVHAEGGKDVDRALAFVQAHPTTSPPSRPASRPSSPTKRALPPIPDVPPPMPRRRTNTGSPTRPPPSRRGSFNSEPALHHNPFAQSDTARPKPPQHPSHRHDLPKPPPPPVPQLPLPQSLPQQHHTTHNPFVARSNPSVPSVDESPAPAPKVPPLPPRKPPPPVPPHHTTPAILSPPPRHISIPHPNASRSKSPSKSPVRPVPPPLPAYASSAHAPSKPVPPPKPATHVTSTLIRQSLQASKAAQTMKRAESQLEKGRVVQVLKSSSTSSSSSSSTPASNTTIQGQRRVPSPSKLFSMGSVPLQPHASYIYASSSSSISTSSSSSSDPSMPPLPRHHQLAQQRQQQPSPPLSASSLEQVAFAAPPPGYHNLGSQQPASAGYQQLHHHVASHHRPPASAGPASASFPRSPFHPTSTTDSRGAFHAGPTMDSRSPFHGAPTTDSPATSPAHGTVDLPPPTHPDRKATLGAGAASTGGMAKKVSGTEGELSSRLAGMELELPPQMRLAANLESFEAIYGPSSPPLSAYATPSSSAISPFSTQATPTTPTIDMSPTTRIFRSKSMHHPSPPLPPLPPPVRRKRPESVQVLSSGPARETLFGALGGDNRPSMLSSSGTNLSRHASLSHGTPSHLGHRRSSRSVSSSTAGDSTPSPLSVAHLQRMLQPKLESLQPRLDLARYKAEAGLSRRGFVRDGRHQGVEGEEEEGLMGRSSRLGMGTGVVYDEPEVDWSPAGGSEEGAAGRLGDDFWTRAREEGVAATVSSREGGGDGGSMAEDARGEKDALKWPVGEGWAPL